VEWRGEVERREERSGWGLSRQSNGVCVYASPVDKSIKFCDFAVALERGRPLGKNHFLREKEKTDETLAH
jgi:hypothetical protein